MTDEVDTRDAGGVFSNVLPGLRELRAPLAAGYLWLLAVWLMFADELPTRSELSGGAIERLYRLQPLISDVGTVVVASVAAYVIGAIVIDVQSSVRVTRSRFPVIGLPMIVVRFTDLGVPYRHLQLSPAGCQVLSALSRQTKDRPECSNVDIAKISDAVLSWIAENRAVLKTRLLDLKPALHSEVDRPDAEATFRMALWPPLAVIAVYLAVATSGFWVLALVLPVALARQWLSLRRRSNDALLTGIAATADLREEVWRGVRPRVGTGASAVERATET